MAKSVVMSVRGMERTTFGAENQKDTLTRITMTLTGNIAHHIQPSPVMTKTVRMNVIQQVRRISGATLEMVNGAIAVRRQKAL